MHLEYLVDLDKRDYINPELILCVCVYFLEMALWIQIWKESSLSADISTRIHMTDPSRHPTAPVFVSSIRNPMKSPWISFGHLKRHV